jgi:hypothetical protein
VTRVIKVILATVGLVVFKVLKARQEGMLTNARSLSRYNT